MLSTGNDIVDLNIINFNRTKDFKFYSRILCPSEHDLFKNFEDKISFEQFVWLLWSIKESVYKYLKRESPSLVFSPIKITVNQVLFRVNDTFKNNSFSRMEGTGFQNQEFYECKVEFEKEMFQTVSLLNKFFISSFANDNSNFNNTIWGIKKIDNQDYIYQSDAVRSFILERLNLIFPGTDLTFIKHPTGYPILLNNQSSSSLPISFAHHGHYVAYSFKNIE